MTRKIYKSAQGKTVDLGALVLQNEQVRAVGNMSVNARGDLLDSANQVIDQKNRQVQRQYKKQTNVTNTQVVTSTTAAKKLKEQQELDNAMPDDFLDAEIEMISAPEPVDTVLENQPTGGLAAAIARTREIKQELEKTARQKAQEQSLKRL